MFLGVFPCDRLPTRFKVPALLVCSLIPTLTTLLENIGWCCTWKTLHMANSLTLLVDAPFRTFLNYDCSNWIFNDRHLQSPISRFCAITVFFYCLHRCRGSNVNAVFGKLTQETAWFKRLFDS